tara:strand:+ start:68 stop:571 length:504 start_codon:yes stop_codon:yes gene_type:complete
MPYTKEEMKEYNRLYRIKNKEKLKEKDRLSRLKNKEQRKQYVLENKERIREQRKQYYLKNKGIYKEYYETNKEYMINRQMEWAYTEKGKKSRTIACWKFNNILCFDYDLLYDIFLSTTRCEFCQVELNTDGKTRKCLDHDHSINDKFNIRGILCNSCNIKDVLSILP